MCNACIYCRQYLRSRLSCFNVVFISLVPLLNKAYKYKQIIWRDPVPFHVGMQSVLLERWVQPHKIDLSENLLGRPMFVNGRPAAEMMMVMKNAF